ncbi:uncharacterized protein B0T23DRAFT_325442 [Neurospora hispaniola]|uniref:Uncharacterized protein n=1 Tax=Neurospora hispaniola TaxID=588809 RepID=A0AAJ0HZM3_9PEZI|nr:hypothetical protein B0T23DRAFT_325442 [Neurospora hispaniola]
MVDWLGGSKWEEYFANAPLVFKPRILAEGQALSHTIDDNECQLCFQETRNSGCIVKCRVCQRVAHQHCHDIYRMRKAPCEEDTGCPLCCPQCPWNPINQGDVPSTATARRNRTLEKKVRKLQRQLRRKPASRVMSSLRYERLAKKIGRKGTKYRRNKLIMAVKKAVKSEDAQTKHEDKAAVLKEEMESPVKIIKVEKTRRLKSEPVVISLL